MDNCRPCYILGIISYSIFYYTNNTWINVVEEFSWPRYFFLLSCLLLLERYDLVPSVLRCPPFYIVYKVIAAIVIANAALFTIFHQIEDLMVWLLDISIGNLVRNMPDVVASSIPYFEEIPKQYTKDDTCCYVSQLLFSLYLLLWVLVSSGYLPQMKGAPSNSCRSRSSSMHLRSTSTFVARSRRRSKPRC